MSNFKNKSEYGVIIINTTNVIDAIKFQKLFISYGIFWDDESEKIIPFKNNQYIYVMLGLSDFQCSHLLNSFNLSEEFARSYKWDERVYTIDDYHNIEMFIKFDGIPMPNYTPRKIIRTI